MRDSGVLATLAAAAAAAAGSAAAGCGGPPRGPAGPAPPPEGASVRISDGGQIYDALNTTDCVKWPSPAVKQRAGRDGWGAWSPDEGVEGKVLAALRHCDGRTQVVLVEVGAWVVPVTSRGVAVMEGPPRPPAIGLTGDAIDDGFDPEGAGWGELDGDWIDDPAWADLQGDYQPSFVLGERVRVTDPGQTYDTIATTDCLTWPSQQLRDRARQGYMPKVGETGTVIGSSPHCYGSVLVVFVETDGGQLAVIGESGLAHQP